MSNNDKFIEQAENIIQECEEQIKDLEEIVKDKHFEKKNNQINQNKLKNH